MSSKANLFKFYLIKKNLQFLRKAVKLCRKHSVFSPKFQPNFLIQPNHD